MDETSQFMCTSFNRYIVAAALLRWSTLRRTDHLLTLMTKHLIQDDFSV